MRRYERIEYYTKYDYDVKTNNEKSTTRGDIDF